MSKKKYPTADEWKEYCYQLCLCLGSIGDDQRFPGNLRFSLGDIRAAVGLSSPQVSAELEDANNQESPPRAPSESNCYPKEIYLYGPHLRDLSPQQGQAVHVPAYLKRANPGYVRYVQAPAKLELTTESFNTKPLKGQD